jgi:hypothetical protein
MPYQYALCCGTGKPASQTTSVSVCPRREMTDEISALRTVPFSFFAPLAKRFADLSVDLRMFRKPPWHYRSVIEIETFRARAERKQKLSYLNKIAGEITKTPHERGLKA